MSVSIELLALIITGLLNLSLGFLVYIRARNDVSNILFFLITIFISTWAASRAVWGVTDSFEYLVTAIIYISAALIAANFLLFSRAFLTFNKLSDIPRGFRYTVFTATLVVIGITVWPGLLIQSVQVMGEEKVILFGGTAYFVYALFIASFFTYGVFILFQKFQKAFGVQRVQLRYVLIGSLLTSAGGMATNLLLPWFGVFDFFWLGPPLTIIMAVLFTYSIIKHHLLSVRVITTELFSALILIVVFIDVLFSESLLEFGARLSVFFIILIFSIFLIRGTLREIQELERLSEAKSTFVSIASHQLRAPLTAIKGFISMIKEGSGSEGDRAGWLEKAYISNERLIRLVNDLLNVSRIERGKIKYNFEDADIVNIIDGVVEEFYAADGFSKAIEFKWKKPEVIVPELRVDAGKLRQVFVNLIDNAIRYTNQGWIGVRVVYLRDLKKVRIVVEDSGIGMSKEDMRDIFELFERGRGGQKASVGGMGIGLYFAKEVIKAHRGRIWAESDGEGKGSKFIVELPMG